MSVYQNTNGMPMADGRNLHMGVAPGEGKSFLSFSFFLS